MIVSFVPGLVFSASSADRRLMFPELSRGDTAGFTAFVSSVVFTVNVEGTIRSSRASTTNTTRRGFRPGLRTGGWPSICFMRFNQRDHVLFMEDTSQGLDEAELF